MSAEGHPDSGELQRSRAEADRLAGTMNRATVKQLIERYFYQLKEGCGNPDCDNKYCASSGKVSDQTPDQAAALAIQLFSQRARLCEDRQATKAAKSTLEAGPAAPLNDNLPVKGANPTCSDKARKPGPYLTEEKLLAIIDKCHEKRSYALLKQTLEEVFSSRRALSRSFLKSRETDRPKADMDKEAVRSLQEEDKDEDTSSPNYRKYSESDETAVDIASVRRAFGELFSIPVEVFEKELDCALVNLAGNIQVGQQDFLRVPLYSLDDLVNVFFIVFEIPILGSSRHLQLTFKKFCSALSCTPYPAQAKLARIWAKHCKARLPELLRALQELILVKAIGGAFSSAYCVQDSHDVTAPTIVMRILYYASMLAGKLDEPEFVPDEGVEVDNSKRPTDDVWEMTQDPLALELRITALDARKPLIPLNDFYNELLSEAIEMDKDFAYYKSEDPDKFCFMNYPFILTPATKALGLYYDNRIRMYSERRMSFFQSVVGQPTNPYLRLKVRRDRLIDDALVELDMITMENPSDLKKQLVVEFEGEQGVDEGGVSKEFFQLIVEEIFNPDYGLFTTQEETQMSWFNPTSFESNARFTLIGIVLGLAIYNNVILDVRFSMVIYRKLLGRKGYFADLEDWSPCLYRTLRELLDYTGDDMPETFMQTFRIAYTDVFGSISYHDLKPNGDEIDVTQQNKKEFVDLYADFLLNQSIERQFDAFRLGFKMVTEESPLVLLFRPEEIEELICGSKVFDFAELEATTEYSGYTVNSKAIRNFWRVAHSLPPESQRKLLQFTTGSDRVPVGGLSKLKMVIGRYGPDSDRLPIAHTCFNFLLLPDYRTIKKLKDRLLKAINYAKGFGML